MKFKVFKEYDLVLKASYGNYLILPPIDERIPLHSVSYKKI